MLSEDDAAYLKEWGVLSSDVVYQGDKVIANGVSIDNDFSNPGNYQQLCENGLGSTLNNGIYMHGGFFLGFISA